MGDKLEETHFDDAVMLDVDAHIAAQPGVGGCRVWCGEHGLPMSGDFGQTLAAVAALGVGGGVAGDSDVMVCDALRRKPIIA